MVIIYKGKRTAKTWFNIILYNRSPEKSNFWQNTTKSVNDLDFPFFHGKKRDRRKIIYIL